MYIKTGDMDALSTFLCRKSQEKEIDIYQGTYCGPEKKGSSCAYCIVTQCWFTVGPPPATVAQH